MGYNRVWESDILVDMKNINTIDEVSFNVWEVSILYPSSGPNIGWCCEMRRSVVVRDAGNTSN